MELVKFELWNEVSLSSESHRLPLLSVLSCQMIEDYIHPYITTRRFLLWKLWIRKPPHLSMDKGFSVCEVSWIEFFKVIACVFWLKIYMFEVNFRGFPALSEITICDVTSSRIFRIPNVHHTNSSPRKGCPLPNQTEEISRSEKKGQEKEPTGQCLSRFIALPLPECAHPTTIVRPLFSIQITFCHISLTAHTRTW